MRPLGPGSRVLLQLGRRGGRGRDQARAPHGTRARRAGQAPHRVRRGRLPRAHAGDARSRLVGGQARAVRARARRLRARAAQRPGRARGRRRARRPAPCWSSRSRARAASGRSTPSGSRLARELCDRHGALLLYDEVQTGIGRCGAWFCPSSPACGPTRSRSPRDSRAACRSARCWPRTCPDAGFERGDHATTFGGSPPDRRGRARGARRDRARGPGRERPRGR